MSHWVVISSAQDQSVGQVTDLEVEVHTTLRKCAIFHILVMCVCINVHVCGCTCAL